MRRGIQKDLEGLHANAVTSASIQLNERMETIVGKIRADPMVKGCSCRSAQRSLTRCEAARQHPLKGRTANGVPPAASRYPPATLLSEIFGQTRIRSIEVKRRNINQGGSALVFSTPYGDLYRTGHSYYRNVLI